MYIHSKKQHIQPKIHITNKNNVTRRVLGDISNTRQVSVQGKKIEKKEVVMVRKPEPIPLEITPLDYQVINEPLYCPEYAASIYNYYFECESLFCPNPNYMEIQKEINPKMRGILIDWLVDVHYKFKLQPETFFLTVNYIDRYLERAVVERKKLQLVGVTAMLIASKYEEIYFPEIRDFVYITDKSYTRDEIKHMESKMVSVLKFDFTVATVYRFLVRFLRAANQSEEYDSVATFIAERIQQEYSLIKYLPSKLAASCIYLANRYMGLDEWNDTLTEYTRYTPDDLKICSCEIENCIIKTSPSLSAVWRKYTRSVRHKASYIVYEFLHLDPLIIP